MLYSVLTDVSHETGIVAGLSRLRGVAAPFSPSTPPGNCYALPILSTRPPFPDLGRDADWLSGRILNNKFNKSTLLIKIQK